VYDRCPNCRGPMMFHGITSIKHVWARWLECSRCGTLTANSEYGMILETTNKPPKDWALARDVDYEGSESERSRQDHLLGMSEVQSDG
jgi:hypothetical protein